MQQTKFEPYFKGVMQRITEMSVSDLHQKMAYAPPLVIDIREAEECQYGVIPQSHWIRRGYLEFQLENLLSEPQTEIVIYCGGGVRSALATDALQNMGFKSVYSLQGGFKEWAEAGFDVQAIGE